MAKKRDGSATARRRSTPAGDKKLYILVAPPPEASTHQWFSFEGLEIDDIQLTTNAGPQGLKSDEGKMWVNPNAILVASEIPPTAND